MPNIKSAKKRVRVNATKAAANKARAKQMPSGPKMAFFCDNTNIAMIPAITATKERIMPSSRSERDFSA